MAICLTPPRKGIAMKTVDNSAVEAVVETAKEGTKLFTPKRLLVAAAVLVVVGGVTVWVKNRKETDVQEDEVQENVKVTETKKHAAK